jgi:hypothetical protein
LGHKEEIKGSGQWKLLDTARAETCWVRDLSQYTLFMWSPEIGLHYEKEGIQIDPKQKANLVQKLTDFNE